MNVEKQLVRQKAFNIINKILVILFLSIMALIIIIPFYWMLNTSFKTVSEVSKDVPTLYPHEWNFENYRIAFLGKKKYTIKTAIQRKKSLKDTIIPEQEKKVALLKPAYDANITAFNLFTDEQKYVSNYLKIIKPDATKLVAYRQKTDELIEQIAIVEKLKAEKEYKKYLKDQLDKNNPSVASLVATLETEIKNLDKTIKEKEKDETIAQKKKQLQEQLKNALSDRDGQGSLYKCFNEKIKYAEEKTKENKQIASFQLPKLQQELKKLTKGTTAYNDKQNEINELRRKHLFNKADIDSHDKYKNIVEIKNDYFTIKKDLENAELNLSAYKDEYIQKYRPVKEYQDEKKHLDNLHKELRDKDNQINENQNLPRDDFSKFFFNTILVGVASTILGTFLSIVGAFALSRLKFKGRDVIFTIMLATMMIPGEMMVITNYITVSKLGWVEGANTVKGAPFLSMIVPFLVTVFHIYLLRQNFKQIPDELYYAAKVDGTSDFKYLWKVMVPLAKSSIITITILKLMGTWNAYIWPNLVGPKDHRLITVWLRTSFNDVTTGRIAIEQQMAATVIVLIPLLLVFIFLRKYIMRGVARGGTKG